MHKGYGNRTMKSISVEDLGTIVKQMINGALEDTEQVAKLYRAIYEELYSEKMTEFEGKTVEQKSTDSSSKTESILNIDDRDELSKCATEESKTNCIAEVDDFYFSEQGDNNNVEKTVNELSELSIKRSLEGLQSRTQHSEEKTVITETKLNEKSLNENEQKNEQAFDIWRKRKMKAIKVILKEEEMKKQEELAAKQEETERRKANHENYLRSRKLLETQRKLKAMQRLAMGEDNSRIQEEKNARIVANQEAFKAWLQRKNSESVERCFRPQKSRPQSAGTRYYNDVEFDSWLDQLDSVLHQKYLRERRYRVRSFYCQPAYYGAAALAMQ